MSASQTLRWLCIFTVVLPMSMQAAECVYKPSMTDAEIEACRHPEPQRAEPKPMTRSGTIRDDGRGIATGPRTPEQIAADQAAYAARVDAANAQYRQQKSLESTPVEPQVGMTIEAARAMEDANEQRSREYHAAHRFDGNSSGWDWRWSQWSGCHTNRTTTAQVVREQWVCGSQNDRKYIYFENGILTTIQD